MKTSAAVITLIVMLLTSIYPVLSLQSPIQASETIDNPIKSGVQEPGYPRLAGRGENWEKFEVAPGRYRLIVYSDVKFIRHPNGSYVPYWWEPCRDLDGCLLRVYSPHYRLELQPDGSLFILSPNGTLLWTERFRIAGEYPLDWSYKVVYNGSRHLLVLNYSYANGGIDVVIPMGGWLVKEFTFKPEAESFLVVERRYKWNLTELYVRYGNNSRLLRLSAMDYEVVSGNVSFVDLGRARDVFNAVNVSMTVITKITETIHEYYLGPLNQTTRIIDPTSTVTTATADTWVDEKNPTTNYGTATTLKAGTGGAGYRKRPLVLFNIPTLETGAEFINATLEMYYDGVGAASGAGKSYCVRKILSSWSENTVTWSTQPTYDSVNTDCITAPTSYPVWISWNVTQDVLDYWNGAWANYGWVIRKAVESTSGVIYLDSRETTNDPRLVITYNKPPYVTVILANATETPLQGSDYFQAQYLYGDSVNTVNLVNGSTTIKLDYGGWLYVPQTSALSNSTHRWSLNYTNPSGFNQTFTENSTVLLYYWHQINVTIQVTTAVGDPLNSSNYVQAEYLNFSQPALTSAIYDGNPAWTWIDESSTIYVNNTSTMSTGTHRWISNDTSREIMEPGTQTFYFYEQFLVEVKAAKAEPQFIATDASNYFQATRDYSLYFDGTDDYAVIRDDAAFNSSQLTIQALLYLPSNPSESQTIVAKLIYPSSGYILKAEPGTSTGAKIAFFVASSGGSQWAVADNLDIAGRWVTVTAGFNGTHQYIYVDDGEAAVYSLSGQLVGNSRDVWIGSEYGVGFLNAYLADLKIYRVGLTPSEIRHNVFNVSYPIREDELAVWLRFNENSGGVVADWSKYGNEATVYGATWSKAVKVVYAKLYEGFGAHGWFERGYLVNVTGTSTGSGPGERWVTNGTNSWAVSGVSAVFEYWDQLNVTLRAYTSKPYSQPLGPSNYASVSTTFFGALQAVAQVWDGHDSWAWVDRGGEVKFSAVSSASNSTHRWATPGAIGYGGVDQSGGLYQATYYQQLLVTWRLSKSHANFSDTDASNYFNATGRQFNGTLTLSPLYIGGDVSDWVDYQSPLTISDVSSGSTNVHRWLSLGDQYTATAPGVYVFRYEEQVLQTLGLSILDAEGDDELSGAVTLLKVFSEYSGAELEVQPGAQLWLPYNTTHRLIAVEWRGILAGMTVNHTWSPTTPGLKKNFTLPMIWRLGASGVEWYLKSTAGSRVLTWLWNPNTRTLIVVTDKGRGDQHYLYYGPQGSPQYVYVDGGLVENYALEEDPSLQILRIPLPAERVDVDFSGASREAESQVGQLQGLILQVLNQLSSIRFVNISQAGGPTIRVPTISLSEVFRPVAVALLWLKSWIDSWSPVSADVLLPLLAWLASFMLFLKVARSLGLRRPAPQPQREHVTVVIQPPRRGFVHVFSRTLVVSAVSVLLVYVLAPRLLPEVFSAAPTPVQVLLTLTVIASLVVSLVEWFSSRARAVEGRRP